MGSYLPVQAAHLLTLREKYGYTQDQVAQKIGSTTKTYRTWEKGRTSPDVDNLIRLSELYDNVSTDYLLGLIEEKNHDLKFICDYTGLSEDSVEELCNCRDDEKQTISELIISSRFHFLVLRLAWLVMSKNRLADALAAVTNLPSEDNHDELFDSLKYARLCAYEANNEWSRTLEAYTECNSLIDKCSTIRRNTISGQP